MIGTPVSETSGGALSADATLLAPAGPAFTIWSVVYAGLLAYTVWQWLPGRADDPRLRATGWLAASSMVLNAGWLLVTQQGWVWVSVLVILALLATLVEIIRRLTTLPATGRAEIVVVDGTFGLYLGWVAVATCANIAAALADSDVTLPSWAAVAILVAVTLASVELARRYSGRWTVAAASAWGLGWIAVGRLSDEPASTLIGITAILAAVVVLAAAVVLHRSPEPV